MAQGDFYIIDYKYDVAAGLARELKISEPFGFRPGPAFWLSRDQIIGAIEDGFIVETLPQVFQKLLQRLLIKVVEVNGQKYLRADGAPIPSDRIC